MSNAAHGPLVSENTMDIVKELSLSLCIFWSFLNCIVSFSFQIAKYHGIHYVKLYNVENKDCKLSSGTFLPNGYLLICDQSNNSLKLFNRIFKFESRLGLPGKPHDLCIYSSNSDGSDIYVTLPRERTVLEVYVEGNRLTLGGEFKTENWCYGITAYKEGLLITVGTKLKFINVNSKFIKNINHRKIGESPFGSPCYLEVTMDNNILISDSLKHMLYCIDETGRELFRYDDMRHPHGIVIVDKEIMCLAGNSQFYFLFLHQNRNSFLQNFFHLL